ncbi:MAG TPA: hypothetical protein VJ300_09355 [Thermoplasmata archaeon]|nr:hypothetical protein [Thermoplasmata archaeon]
MGQCKHCRSELHTSDSKYGHILGCGELRVRAPCRHSPGTHKKLRASPYDERLQISILEKSLGEAGLPDDEATARKLADRLGEVLRAFNLRPN